MTTRLEKLPLAELADYHIWKAAHAVHGVDIEHLYHDRRRWPDGRPVTGEHRG